MFDAEKIKTNPEYDEYIRDIIKGHEDEIQSLLMDTTTRLGEGRTAYVSFMNFKTKICVKIFKKPENIVGVDFYLTPAKEEVFMENMKGVGGAVRVPKVYCSFEDEDKEGHDFVMMEALPAVSIDDVLSGRADLPENFDLNSFQIEMEKFIEKMHERHIYHRDLHEGNIMIDKETGKPYVIDFGAANLFWGSVERGERGPYHITKNGKDIMLTSDENMVRAVMKKLRAKLTNND